MYLRHSHRPRPLSLPATESVELGNGLRYEGLWVDGRWRWSLWLDAKPVCLDAQGQLGSYAIS